MATSAVEICNSALLKLGAQRISSLIENNKRAKLCNERYEGLRKEVLRAHPWNFAIGRATLVQLGTTPEFEYNFEYALPTDCLRVLNTEDESGTRSRVQAVPNSHLYFEGGVSNRAGFKIEGRKLLTNETEVRIRYILDLQDTTKFDPNFDDALATRMAAEFSYALVQSNSLSANMYGLYDLAMARARTRDGQEGTPDDLQADFFVTSRF